jgi:hypothetical protein
VTLRGIDLRKIVTRIALCDAHDTAGSRQFLPERFSAELRLFGSWRWPAPTNVSDRGATVPSRRAGDNELRTAAVGTLRLPVLPGKLARGMQGQSSTAAFVARFWSCNLRLVFRDAGEGARMPWVSGRKFRHDARCEGRT